MNSRWLARPAPTPGALALRPTRHNDIVGASCRWSSARACLVTAAITALLAMHGLSVDHAMASSPASADSSATQVAHGHSGMTDQSMSYFDVVSTPAMVRPPNGGASVAPGPVHAMNHRECVATLRHPVHVKQQNDPGFPIDTPTPRSGQSTEQAAGSVKVRGSPEVSLTRLGISRT